MKPEVRTKRIIKGGVPGTLTMEISRGPRPPDRYGWDTYSYENSLWTQQKFTPDATSKEAEGAGR